MFNLNHVCVCYFTNGACGDYSFATKERYVEILDFKHFLKHIVFIENSDKSRNKEIKNYINVSVVVDIECGDTIK
ncbi:MAG: hypothetical protein LKF87_07865 [Clostridium tyrobutyricum]|nr:hypothetical protein [Clostridium tyrobutyricum]MCH4258871.1 hypothetical protein [Clostridium tyrobutyricum]MCI1239781.1 hypothetical protein [Clostridium tyrobutyricum]MCI1651437.1 hypothetical protein [Clostridium tyrobutyricum]